MTFQGLQGLGLAQMIHLQYLKGPVVEGVPYRQF